MTPLLLLIKLLFFFSVFSPCFYIIKICKIYRQKWLQVKWVLSQYSGPKWVTQIWKRGSFSSGVTTSPENRAFQRESRNLSLGSRRSFGSGLDPFESSRRLSGSGSNMASFFTLLGRESFFASKTTTVADQMAFLGLLLVSGRS